MSTTSHPKILSILHGSQIRRGMPTIGSTKVMWLDMKVVVEEDLSPWMVIEDNPNARRFSRSRKRVTAFKDDKTICDASDRTPKRRSERKEARKKMKPAASVTKKRIPTTRILKQTAHWNERRERERRDTE
jgi:hypothetical protein